MSGARRADWLRRYWDKCSAGYDKQMAFFERVLFADTRDWICEQATGDVLEVAVGTGLNLPHYPPDVRLIGVDFSKGMLDVAALRAKALGRTVELKVANAHELGMPDAVFDTVVCTFALCAIPDERRAVGEMVRVLRPGGLLLLADHVAGSWLPVRAVQRLAEAVTVPLGGEHFTRRPIGHVLAHGLVVERHDRFKLGIVERLAARKPL